MKYRLSVRRSVFQDAFRSTAKILDGARKAGPAAVLCLTVLTLGVVCLSEVYGALRAPARQQETAASSTLTFTIIDAPGAGTGVLQGTFGVSINAAGDIAGVYLTAPNVAHGFVRTANGTITTFDVSGAGTALNQGTFPISINTAGDIAGMYFGANNAYHGFVRAANGTITTFDVPGAPTSIGHRGTNPTSINTTGDITGMYVDTGAVRHGFVRAANGTVTKFDVTGVGSNPLTGTIPASINSAGDIAGFYIEPGGLVHGFVRSAANGTITAPIDAPGAGTGPKPKGFSFMGTLPVSIDTAGDIAGISTDTNGVHHGFVRAANGTFTTIDVPGAGTAGLFPGTLPTNINPAGDVAGFYEDANGVNHGFVRLAASGTITNPIDVPGASTTGMFSGTVPFSISTAGNITGTYSDTNAVFHGFLLTPATTAPPAATPTFSPPAGTYTSAQTVTISDATPGATIHFRTDGQPPTTADPVFANPITVNTTETITAIAVATGFSQSAEASALYTINLPPAATPTFSVPAGTYTSAQTVTISDTTPGATIHFTTDGSTPTATSPAFSTPINVNTTETIKAIAAASGFSNSAVATATYTINLPAADFQLSVNPSTLTIVAGQSGKATFTVTPQNGFNSQVNFACSGLPSEAACSFSPTSVTPSGAAASSTLTVTTSAASAAMRVPIAPSQRPLYALLFPGLAMVFGIAARRRRAPRGVRLFGLLILLMLALGLTSCSGGSTNPGTPIGTSTVSVSASASGAGAINHTANLTITITH